MIMMMVPNMTLTVRSPHADTPPLLCCQGPDGSASFNSIRQIEPSAALRGGSCLLAQYEGEIKVLGEAFKSLTMMSAANPYKLNIL